MNCKPGDLAVIVRSHDERNIGKIVKVLRPYTQHVDASWYIVSDSVLYALFSDWPPGAEVGQYDSNLRPFRDQPGNESFVTESRKSLPRTKDAVRITERGEVA